MTLREEVNLLFGWLISPLGAEVKQALCFKKNNNNKSAKTNSLPGEEAALLSKEIVQL